MFLFVWVYMYEWVHTPLCAHVEAGGIGCLPFQLSLLRQVLSLNLEIQWDSNLLFWLDYLASNPLRAIYLHSSSATMLRLSLECCGSKLKSSCLHSKHFVYTEHLPRLLTPPIWVEVVLSVGCGLSVISSLECFCSLPSVMAARVFCNGLCDLDHFILLSSCWVSRHFWYYWDGHGISAFSSVNATYYINEFSSI